MKLLPILACVAIVALFLPACASKQSCGAKVSSCCADTAKATKDCCDATMKKKHSH